MATAMRSDASAALSGSATGLIVASVAFAVAVVGTAAWLVASGPLPPVPVAVDIPKLVVPPPATPEAVESETETAPPAAVPIAPGGLAATPDPALVEKGDNGPLPIVGKDGRASWQVYARPFNAADKRPRIAIVVSNLGTSATATDTAIRSLPAEVSLSFMPYRKRLSEWMTLARAAGHEVLLDLPMEPPDLAHNDPGPHTLLNGLDAGANQTRLEWMMSQATGYIGMTGYLGGHFEIDRGSMKPVLANLRKRGLLYLDNRASPQSVGGSVAGELGLPFAAADRQLDTDPSRAGVDRKLAELEDVARHGGSAIGLGEASEAVLDRVAAWSQTLEARGLVLAPVSALAAVTPSAAKPAWQVKPAAPDAGPKPTPAPAKPPPAAAATPPAATPETPAPPKT